MRIRFVRLQKSEMIKEVIEDRVLPVLEKHSVDPAQGVQFDVEMENSPTQPGRDLYRLKINIKDGDLKGFILEKSDLNFYRALSALTAALGTNLKRFSEKKQHKALSDHRRIKNAANH